MYVLHIDESGKNFLRAIEPNRPHFLVAAVMIDKDNCEELKNKADQIKFKYWGRTDIVFHAVDIKGSKGPFSIFRRPGAKFTMDDFLKDLVKFIKEARIQIGLVCINRHFYIAANPPLAAAVNKFGTNRLLDQTVKGEEKKLMESHTEKLLIMYLHFLKQTGSKGQVAFEATGSGQDLYSFGAYNNLLGHGYPGFAMNGEDVRKYLTSVAFVTKNNHDIESQLADLVGFMLNIEARTADGIEPITNPAYKDIISALRSKSFQFAETNTEPLRDSFVRLI